MKTCAFTGHRVLAGTDYDAHLLERVVADLSAAGVTRFLCGMAVGFDMEAARAVVTLKEKRSVELVACLPCANQSERFSQKNKLLYDNILKLCDERVILQERYTDGCMQRRDRYMVDNCDVLVCFLRRNSGGTYYTVKYAERSGKKIIQL